MSKQTNVNHKSLELFDWMLAIDLDPAKYQIDRSKAELLSKMFLD
jgi:hypothetical protein